ncbi:zinc finger protein 271 [Manduca sexta]|uniref:zinc finger protein 271 n=1 Tax=Manduca sexta TaxID=7130 RepID=UPI001182218C|nr:zinc finger protein 271 [Manduca sexta]
MAENPLEEQAKDMVKPNVYTTNLRGRPTLEKSIVFSPQPKSMVAQLLSKKKVVPCDTTISIVSNETSNEVPSVCDESKQHEIYACGECSYRSENIQDYRKHLTSHKQFNCDFDGCNYTCKLLSNLIKHRRVHTDERPYLCDRCSFRTNFINSLKAHRRTHTMERPYHCKQCDYKCNSSSNLKKHCLQKHPEIFIKCK